ncbi:hypothetical protein NIES3787_01090 [Microcystis aeruginosa NIES-3787]|uniref:Uncharacterized protein n=1 Tax=Microcystis aeruginosa NIES-3787 TaxID=2517782 RepID=A0A6H9FII0_MICAE|nr:hypothetical protein NIES3787_01090 [Microcystis aeruginosa NIES-3787]
MGVVGIGIIYFLSYYIIPASPIRGSLILCVISLIDIGAIDLCVLCISVVRSTHPPALPYLRIHFKHRTHQKRYLSLKLNAGFDF